MRFTQVYTPQDNGIAEHRMQMIMKKVRAMIFDSHHPIVLTGEAIMTTVYIINITPTEVLDGESPHERWYHSSYLPLQSLLVYSVSARFQRSQEEVGW